MNRIAELRDAISKARQAYYYTPKPIMTDEAYDALEVELRKEIAAAEQAGTLSPRELDELNKFINQVGAPYPPDHILEAATHRIHMGSQDKVTSEQGFREWYAKYARGGKIHGSLKGDGGSAASYYEDGPLTMAASRGDGSVGENITANAARFKGLPSYIPGFTGAIRYEAILTKADWAIVGGKNPRNQGNGIIGRKDGVESNYITAYAFGIDDENRVFTTETEKSQTLESMGVNVMPWKTFNNVEDAIKWHNEIMLLRGPENTGSLPFWIDGTVWKVDDLSAQDEFGMSSDGKYFRAQTAWKPESPSGLTILRSWELRGGHTGSLTPRVSFDPVEIAKTTVSNAYLSNFEEVERLGVAIGDTVRVSKRNDIIPHVEEVVIKAENRVPIVEPANCPFCGAKTERRASQSGEGAITICPNQACPKKSIKKVKNWFKKVEILGVGDATLDALFDDLNITTPADIYKLGRSIPMEELAELVVSENRLGESRAQTLIAEIDQKRHLPLHIFLGSLGVDDLGRREVEIAVEKAPDELSTLADWRAGKLYDPDFCAKINAPNKGLVWQESIDRMSDVIDALLANGVTVENFVAAPKGTATVCITGKLPSGKTKAEYVGPLTQAGFTLVDDVSKDLGFLVVADPSKTSSKQEKVKKYNAKGSGIKVIDEDQLNKMIQ